MDTNNASAALRELARQVADKARECRKIAVLTGAGVSAESGIPTFREAQTGLWERYDPVMLASVDGFRADPANVWKWYDERRQTMSKSRPNPGHEALATWEKLVKGQGGAFTVITQNIDNLHRQAGSESIIEMHGNIWYVRPVDAPFNEAFLLDECPLVEIPPRDERGRMLRPHVVWFGEMLDPDNLEAAFSLAVQAELFLSIGTSTAVYPAAALPFEAKRRGAVVVEINPHETELTRFADFSLAAPSGVALPLILDQLRADGA
ncbi:NAD-dependent deacylase [bacterium]|nr:NAD-dependent deacylase [bacterium]